MKHKNVYCPFRKDWKWDLVKSIERNYLPHLILPIIPWSNSPLHIKCQALNSITDLIHPSFLVANVLGHLGTKSTLQDCAGQPQSSRALWWSSGMSFPQWLPQASPTAMILPTTSMPTCTPTHAFTPHPWTSQLCSCSHKCLPLQLLGFLFIFLTSAIYPSHSSTRNLLKSYIRFHHNLIQKFLWFFNTIRMGLHLSVRSSVIRTRTPMSEFMSQTLFLDHCALSTKPFPCSLNKQNLLSSGPWTCTQISLVYSFYLNIITLEGHQRPSYSNIVSMALPHLSPFVLASCHHRTYY